MLTPLRLGDRRHRWFGRADAQGRARFRYRRYGSAEQLGEAFSRLRVEQIVPAIRRGLSATVYTQLSDVEDELNGLLTYDRETLKLPAELVRSVNALLRLE
ncbi:hypothetical protein ACFV0L_02700 [Streptosporangium canum]|uniref:hypothetical protein n=1 Tax=Streptosporangium canum TaxID=324952 RepID=UPI003694BEEE